MVSFLSQITPLWGGFPPYFTNKETNSQSCEGTCPWFIGQTQGLPPGQRAALPYGREAHAAKFSLWVPRLTKIAQCFKLHILEFNPRNSDSTGLAWGPDIYV